MVKVGRGLSNYKFECLIVRLTVIRALFVGGDPVFVLDENGCEIDRYVLQNLDYPGDLIGGQWAYVFKFADKPTLHFNCAIELALKDRQAACTKTVD